MGSSALIAAGGNACAQKCTVKGCIVPPLPAVC